MISGFDYPWGLFILVSLPLFVLLCKIIWGMICHAINDREYQKWEKKYHPAGKSWQ